MDSVLTGHLERGFPFILAGAYGLALAAKFFHKHAAAQTSPPEQPKGGFQSHKGSRLVLVLVGGVVAALAEGARTPFEAIVILALGGAVVYYLHSRTAASDRVEPSAQGTEALAEGAFKRVGLPAPGVRWGEAQSKWVLTTQFGGHRVGFELLIDSQRWSLLTPAEREALLVREAVWQTLFRVDLAYGLTPLKGSVRHSRFGSRIRSVNLVVAAGVLALLAWVNWADRLGSDGGWIGLGVLGLLLLWRRQAKRKIPLEADALTVT